MTSIDLNLRSSVLSGAADLDLTARPRGRASTPLPHAQSSRTPESQRRQTAFAPRRFTPGEPRRAAPRRASACDGAAIEGADLEEEGRFELHR